MPKAIRFYKNGGPDVFRWEDVTLGDPGPGEARITHKAVGLNFIDCYFRSGLYAPPSFPSGVGVEGAGVVDAVGRGVKNVKRGDRVVYALGPLGAYSEQRVLPAGILVKLPAGVSFEQGAAVMLKGMTAQYLIRRTYRVKKGDTILWHAAAGGVGLIACQWAKSLGARVIGTVGGAEKAKLAKRHGCSHVIDYNKGDFVKRVREITKGKGVPVVYDSVGKQTFLKSLDCLAPLGTMVLFGQSSGPPDALNVGTLAAKGSLFLTRPGLANYTATRDDLEACARDLFRAVRSGAVKVEIRQRLPLKDAAKAHRALESRKTTGSTVLIP
jgi:NADPH2:quinone reductase